MLLFAGKCSFNDALFFLVKQNGSIRSLTQNQSKGTKQDGLPRSRFTGYNSKSAGKIYVEFIN